MTDVLVRRGNWDTDTHGGETHQSHREEEKTIFVKTRREASEETNFTDTLILDLSPPEQKENNFLLLKLPSLWYLVIATPRN